MAKDTIMVVMPAYNEAGSIRNVIGALPKQVTVGERHFKVRIVVVEDGSTDDTYHEAKSAGVTVLRHIMNSGAGAATRTGLRYAEKNGAGVAYVVTIDADGQHKTEDIKRLVEFAEKHHAQMVVGNRLHKGNAKDMPWHRQVGNYGLSLISRILFGITTEDTQSGLRLLTPDILPKVSNYTIDRYGFCTEMLWHAIRSGIKVYEMPISVRYSRESLAHGQNNWGVIDLVRDLIWIRISR